MYTCKIFSNSTKTKALKAKGIENKMPVSWKPAVGIPGASPDRGSYDEGALAGTVRVWGVLSAPREVLVRSGRPCLSKVLPAPNQPRTASGPPEPKRPHPGSESLSPLHPLSPSHLCNVMHDTTWISIHYSF